MGRPGAGSLPAPERAGGISQPAEERGKNKHERHKSGETVEVAMLQGVDKLLRYKKKEFEFPYGWGFDQGRAGQSYFSAHGTISFFIDSTAKLSGHLYGLRNWKEFDQQFFGALRAEICEALQKVLSERVGRQDFHAERIEDYLSSMSVELTDLLNGEGPADGEPVFRKYGLRVKQTDIMGLHLYSIRR